MSQFRFCQKAEDVKKYLRPLKKTAAVFCLNDIVAASLHFDCQMTVSRFKYVEHCTIISCCTILINYIIRLLMSAALGATPTRCLAMDLNFACQT